MRCATVWMPNGLIYAIGGMAIKGLVNSVEVLPRARSGATDNAENKWRYLAPMNLARNFHSATAFNDQILVVGGFHGYVGIRADVIEMFTPPKLAEELGQWTIVCLQTSPEIVLNIYHRDDTVYVLCEF